MVASLELATRADAPSKQNTVDAEVEIFWERFLQKNGNFSVPVPPPTSAPVQIETDAPTTLAPSPQPTLLPTVVVTTATPTPEPMVDCVVEVSLDCADSDGVSCDKIRMPPRRCAVGESIAFVSFSYTGEECSTSRNSQSGKSVCQDFAPMPDSPVTVQCRPGNRTMGSLIVEPAEVPVGGTFTVSDSNGNDLPVAIDCGLFGPDDNLVQELIIDTSGDVTLNLGNTFGALILLSCSEDKSCFKTLTYTVDINNIGFVSMNINEADFTFDNETTSLLQFIDDESILTGQSVSVELPVEVNICAGEQITAETFVQANPPNGDQCSDSQQYIFTAPVFPTPFPVPSPTSRPVPLPTLAPVQPPTSRPIPPPTPAPVLPVTAAPTEICSLDVTLDCEAASNGVQCDQIQAPMSNICSDGTVLEIVTMSYQNLTCDQSSNEQGDASICEESAPLDFEKPKTIECATDDGITFMTVEPRIVAPRQSFTITSPSGGALPGRVGCRLLDVGTGTLVQFNGIDFSGTVPLKLGDTFGALELDGCNDLSCREVLNWRVDISNTGSSSIDFTKVDLTINNVTNSFVQQIIDDPLGPGRSTSLEPTIEVDICSGTQYNASIVVEGKPANGPVCQDNDFYFFTAPTLSSTPIPLSTDLSPRVRRRTPVPKKN